MNKDHTQPYPEFVGNNTELLLEQIDREASLQPEFRDQLKQSLKLLADLKFALDESSIVAITNKKGFILYVNDRFCKVSQYSREELLGKDHRMISAHYHSKAFIKELWDTINAGHIWRGDIKNRAKDNSFYWVNTTIVPFLDEKGSPIQFLAIRNEVTKLKYIEEKLQIMMNRIMLIQEEERKRFSRELHDGIGQSLFSLLIQFDRYISEFGHSVAIDKLRRNISSIMEEVRNLAWELRPSVLDDLGIVPALRTYIENYSQHFAIEVKFETNLRRRLDIQVETTIYRVIQEALINVSKHAGVSDALVTLFEKDQQIEAQIIDSGKGFVDSRNRQGVGLFSMEERARGIGGQLNIVSKTGMGTCVTLNLPISSP